MAVQFKGESPCIDAHTIALPVMLKWCCRERCYRSEPYLLAEKVATSGGG